jgi:hypothetical protein
VGVDVKPWQQQAPRPSRDNKAIRATGDMLALVDARIASHGADGLPEWLGATFGHANMTDRACILSRLMRENYGRAFMDLCREALP